MTIGNSARPRLFNIVLFNMGDLHLVLPALNLSTLNAGILIMMQQVRLIMFSLNMVDYSMSFLLLSNWAFRGDHSEPFLLFVFFCGQRMLRSSRKRAVLNCPMPLRIQTNHLILRRHLISQIQITFRCRLTGDTFKITLHLQ